MSNELVINATQNGGRIALLRDKSLVEFHYENNSANFVVGDIFLGIVRRVVPGLNAAFIDIGYEKDAFLHYLDLGLNFRSMQKFVKMVQNNKYDNFRLNGFKMEPPLDKLGKISDVLKVNQQVLVQVVKEPISTKGPRLSCELSLAGRHIVLVPFANSVNVSKKVTDNAERKRLIRLLSSVKPENFGIIIRTVAEGKDITELNKDLDELLAIWQKGIEKLQTAKPREKIIGEVSRANSMLRDMLNETFDSITVDDRDMYEDIKAFIRNIAPEKEKIVKLYTGKAKIFEAFGIEKQVKLLFGPTVSLPSGGYIVIEHTEALHVIDVNSGNKSNAESTQESTAFAVNMEAATEIARQLRLRDMGGIIVIDFIDMKSAEHKRMLYEHIKAEMKADRAKFTVLPLTKFGLMQITRQRVRPELNISTLEKCPTCNGTGKISASISVADQIESKLDYILTRQNESKIVLIVHPYLYAYFTAGWPSIRLSWFFKYKKWVRIEKDSSLGVTEFYFKNQQDQFIEL
ncbi:MAG: Rne/Rng family ribonuclease [Cytophagales bacterium]|nr:Rne/Rng family ribonuclease [Bernardetiaceae bacterium]MDW8204439.1 Rne/Rng family ribonuclease [Cytophagales bacterium]